MNQRGRGKPETGVETMRRLYSLASFVTALVLATNMQAETPESKPAATAADPKYKGLPVVFVDVRYILDHYTPLKTQLDEWRHDLGKLDDRQREERRQILTLKQTLKELRPDSPDYLPMELDIAQREGKSKGSHEVHRNQLLRRRASMFLDAYNVIRKDVDQFVKDHEIGAALTFDGNFAPSDPISIPKPAKVITVDEGGWSFGSGNMSLGPGERYVVEEFRSTPEKVEELITRPALSVNPDRDITPLILRRINDAAAKEKAAAEMAKEKEAKVKKPKEAAKN